MPMYYLLKTEPEAYSIDDLKRDGETVWDGVKNNLALQNLRKIQKGDYCFIYHTGKEKQLVGLAVATSDSYLPQGESNSALAVFKLRFSKKYLLPLTLEQMKANDLFKGFDLIRLPRLSVMQVPDPYLKEIITRIG
ncbi:MAG: EVE domain-containing protein [Chlorobiales bacterium]|nr:EVE domain-containing protein [Chlorobiales bacterium]